MFSPESLFIRNIDQLKAAVEQPSTENLFEGGRLLRQLLTDENPYLHQANRNTKLKIIFVVNEFRSSPPNLRGPNNIYMPEISPAMGLPGKPTKTVNLDGFLAHYCLEAGLEQATVKDLIRYVANYAGAVHRNTPDTPLNKSLEAVSQAIQIGGAPTVLRCLRSVADVAVMGCQPLYDKLREAEPG